jgi:hypothetical protein
VTGRRLGSWERALEFVVVFVAALCIGGFLAVGERHEVLRLLFLGSLALLVLAPVVLLWGGSQHAAALALLGSQAEQLRSRRSEFRERIAGRVDPRERSHWEALERSNDELASAVHLADELARHGAKARSMAVAASELERQSFASDDEVAVLPPREVQRRRVAQRLLVSARRATLAGLAALALAIPTGIGTAVAGIIDSAAHIGPPASAVVQPARSGAAETCIQAETQVAQLGKADPAVARLYAQGVRGLPALVEPEVQRRCGGNFSALLR